MGRAKPDTWNSDGRRHLLTHIEGHWSSLTEFAEHAEIPAQTLYNIAAGAQCPNLLTAVKIERMSAKKGDAIAPREWEQRKVKRD